MCVGVWHTGARGTRSGDCGTKVPGEKREQALAVQRGDDGVLRLWNWGVVGKTRHLGLETGVGYCIPPFQGLVDWLSFSRGVAPGCMDFAPLGRGCGAVGARSGNWPCGRGVGRELGGLWDIASYVGIARATVWS